MKRDQLRFLASDAWLLLAIVIAAGNTTADFKEIIAVGDDLNHSIFTRDEFESGLYRLVNGGYIEEVDGDFKPTTTTSEAHKEIAKQARGFHKQMEAFRELIDAPPWEVGKVNLSVGNKFKYPGFKENSFQEAVAYYQGNASNVLRELRKKNPSI